MADILIQDLSPAEVAGIAALLGDRQHQVVELVWTPHEAAALLAQVAAPQRQLIEQLVHWDGVITVDALRGKGAASLRGSTGPITKAVNRLSGAGTIREGLPRVLTSVYDPDQRSFQRVRAYRMDESTLAAFRAAMTSSTNTDPGAQ